MWPRYVIASIGGFAITVAMFLGMSEVSKLFKERDPTRYLRVFDVLPGPGPAPPERIEPQRAPQLPQIERRRDEVVTLDVAPRVEGAAPVPLSDVPQRPEAQPGAQAGAEGREP